MAFFRPSDYYPIFVSSLVIDEVLPFDCFVLVGKVRVLPWASRGEVFSLAKFQKLESGSISTVYVRNEDKGSYFQHLDEFFMTKEGKRVLARLREQKDLSSVVGLPSRQEYSLQSWPDIPLLGPSATPESDESAETGLVTEEKAKEVVCYLKENVERMETAIQTDAETEKERITIKSATLNITEEIKRIGRIKVDDKDYATKISSSTLRISDEVILIKGYAGRFEEARFAQEAGQKIKERLEKFYSEISSRSDNSNPTQAEHNAMCSDMSAPVGELNEVVSTDSKSVISVLLKTLAHELQDKTNPKLIVKDETASSAGNPSLPRLIQEKNKLIEELNREIKTHKKEKKTLQKELSSALDQIAGTSNQMPQESPRDDRDRAVEVRLKMTEGQLNQAKTAIEKLTRHNEELKAEKQKYIVQVNEGLAQQRALMKKITTLEQNLYSAEQKIEDLTKRAG